MRYLPSEISASGTDAYHVLCVEVNNVTGLLSNPHTTTPHAVVEK